MRGNVVRRYTLLPVLFAMLQFTCCGLTNPCLVSPSITGQPSSQTVAAGQTALFTVAASGSGAIAYQWMKNGVAISRATQTSYLTPVSTMADSGASLAVVVSNSVGTITSLTATLTVKSQVQGNVRFVAPNGSDSNAVTIGEPYRTIQHCATNISPGWTCEVRAGTYRETVVPNSGITVDAYNYEPVTVDGSDPITNWKIDHDHTYKANVNLNLDDTNQIFVGHEMM